MAISGLGKSPLSSQIIGGRYRVECCIASGVEASVVGAVDCATGKRVTLKCWDGPTSEQEVAAMQCFMRSANVSALFENPHVVEVFATELGDTVSYSVSEWLEGSTLAREVERLGRLTVQDALRHVLPCLRAVAEAHAAGIIHGDIRPAHIFLSRAKRHVPERARVFDFGRGLPGFSELRLPARAVVDELCRYTPPELLHSGVLDARSDIYAFGLLLYEVTTGERIFVADDLRDLLREIEQGPKRAISDMTQSLPRGFVEVLYRAMALDPEQRYQDLASLLDALTPFHRNVAATTARASHVPPRRADPGPDPTPTRAYPSRGPWMASSSPAGETARVRPRALVTLSRIAAMSPRSAKSLWRDLEEKIIIPRRRPLWQAAAVATFFGVSYLALDQGVQGVQGGAPPAADRVTSQSPALHTDTDTDNVEAAAPHDPSNTFDPLPVPSVNDNHLRERERDTYEPTRFSSVAGATPPSRRARRAERRRAAAAARAALAAEASKPSVDDSLRADQPVEIRRPSVPVIDESISAPDNDAPAERMELQ